MNDSLTISVPKDTLTTQTIHINKEFSHTTVGYTLSGLIVLGFIYTVFIFKRPNRF